MKEFRFIATTHHHVSADTLEEAIERFQELKQRDKAHERCTITRIDVLDEHDTFVPVDHPMRAKYVSTD